MRCLSMWQPWASLWCSDAKEHETRGWELHHRGWLLVHAAKRPIDKDVGYSLEIITREYFGVGWRSELPRGSIIGAVDIVDVIATSVLLKEFGAPIDSAHWTDYQCGNYARGRFGFRSNEFKRFLTPIPYRGQRGPFNVPDELVREAMGL